MGDPKHFQATSKNKVGVFDKSPDYRDICRGCGHGYHGGLWQAHHVLPGVALQKATIESQVNNAKKAEYIENCKWITDWNLNKPYNMMGLPTIWDYIIAEKITQTAGSDSEVIRLSDYRSKLIQSLVKALGKNFVEPENFPAHNPVSWGHVVFNNEVKDNLTVNIWDVLDEKKEKHKINPENIQSKLNKAAKQFMTKLTNRGKRQGGTAKNWPKRFETGNTTWFHPFSMAAKPENPL
jgi:hypothetical protein